MKRILMLGSGKVGSLIACLLAETGDYQLHVGDVNPEAIRHVSELGCDNLTVHVLDAMNRKDLEHFLGSHSVDAVISCLPYYCNFNVSEMAHRFGLHYFDLTEDVDVARHIAKTSREADTAFVPQCGLAPGFISIVANELMTHFQSLDTVKLRVGALPINPSNALKYSLTWSTDGLINEYGNFCTGVENGEQIVLLPLEGYETISVDGLLYECFNTSGGIGTLAETYRGRVRTMNYKTLRYPGHCEKVHFLMQDLKLNHDRDTLKRILENAVPKTLQDVVIIYVSVTGRQNGELFEENYVKKFYSKRIAGRLWSAIQVTTASGLCGVLDLILQSPGPPKGFVTQESIKYSDFLQNRFGQYYR
ncbi:MAG: saccharopine dehydrogenase family protein [Acidobacteria bacterium]|nr:saccharopine dehydrogenase family protein [Acidobacteriota bacterium]